MSYIEQLIKASLEKLFPAKTQCELLKAAEQAWISIAEKKEDKQKGAQKTVKKKKKQSKEFAERIRMIKIYYLERTCCKRLLLAGKKLKLAEVDEKANAHAHKKLKLAKRFGKHTQVKNRIKILTNKNVAE